MEVEQEAVTAALRARGDHDRAAFAAAVLPRTVDTVREAGLLHQLDLNTEEVELAVAEADDEAPETGEEGAESADRAEG